MAHNLRSQLESSLGRSYRIERELSGGGMARVFVATDRALGRRVVIKVLSSALGAELSAKRFEREIRLAASLQQANIVPLLSAGEIDGLPHYTMPFVEGRSLRERLTQSGRPTLGETIAILRDVARALAYAHEHGVVHRDIKPDNVLLSGDAAVVTDFGIAKALATARTAFAATEKARHESTMTQAGTAIGTPPYMAPEQISADPDIDHRADLYSFGCLAYELLTGEPPFGWRPAREQYAAHLSERPVPVGEKNPDMPPLLAACVMQCLEKDPALRPKSAREILRVLDTATAPATGLTRLVQRLSVRQRRAALGILVAGVAALVMLLWPRSVTTGAPPPVAMIAVLPFANLSGDSADEYIAEGLADGVNTALGKVPGFRVKSRSLSYQYKGMRFLDARDVGGSLSVDHVVQGSLRRIGGRLRVSAQLTSVADNRELWAEDYDMAATDAFTVQDAITRRIASALSARLSGGDTAVAIALTLPATASSGMSNPEAYDLYMRGRFLLQRRGRGVRQAIEKLEQAIAKDSTFAHAHAALALALELLPYFEHVNADSLGRLAIPAARRALAMDSSLAEAHTALAMAHQHRYEWRLAEESYKRAIAVEPPDADAFIQYGRFLFYTRTVDEALPMFERARVLDPTSAVASGWVGHLLELSGRRDEAFVHLRRAMEIDSTNPPAMTFMAMAFLHAGRPDSARAVAERTIRVWPEWRNSAATTFAQLGDTARALAALRVFESTGRIYLNAGIYAALGDSLRWFATMEEATRRGEIWPTYSSLSQRHLDFMRGSARFAKIVRDVGLDEKIFTSPTGGRPR